MFIKRYLLNASYPKLSAIAFLAIILTGATLLSLPISSRTGEFTPFIDALFTATTATCVTGLTVFDTFTHHSLFGQVVILSLIQIGGLGFMVMGTLLALAFHRKIGIKERYLLKESISNSNIGGIVRLAKHILIGTILIEGMGALLLAARFIPKMGIAQGIYYGIFHSVSAFCNAGIDLMGKYGQFSSLTHYSGDIVVNVIIMLLIIIGGIGFVVWEDLYTNKFSAGKLSLHSRLVLTATTILVFGGAIVFYVLEKNNIFTDTSTKETILQSLFLSVSPRTAGFNTVDLTLLSRGSKLLTMLLMIVGGSPGSTAGGIKTTTFLVALLTTVSAIRKTDDLNVYNRRLEDDLSVRSFTIITLYIIASTLGIFIIGAVQPGFSLEEIAFEVYSALSTVGCTLGITTSLNSISKLVIITLMYFGRVGSLTLLIALTGDKKNKSSTKRPVGKIILG